MICKKPQTLNRLGFVISKFENFWNFFQNFLGWKIRTKILEQILKIFQIIEMHKIGLHICEEICKTQTKHNYTHMPHYIMVGFCFVDFFLIWVL